MQLTAQLKLNATAAQAVSLSRTLAASNAACDYISERAWETKIFRQFDLHHLCYREVRIRFRLTAQAAVRAIQKVADA
jgi:putative transposase